jgi:hypothetical protein
MESEKLCFQLIVALMCLYSMVPVPWTRMELSVRIHRNDAWLLPIGLEGRMTGQGFGFIRVV